MKVLIVEDDKWYAESLASSLRSIQEDKIETIIANDAEDAVLKIDEQIPDKIILDFHLGSQNALVMLNELQSYTDTRFIPIVMLSSDASIMNINDFKQFGVKAICDKTIATPKEICQCLKV